MTTYSLYELNEFIRRVVALNVPQAVWVSAEIAQCKTSRGHVYIDLIQKEEFTDVLVAKSGAVIWASDYRRLKRQYAKELAALLQEGMEVKLLARVDFHERYGFKLIIEDVDPSYTLGQMEAARRKTLALLQQQSLLDKNKEIPLPLVLQRIALISSETAAGYRDFVDQLSQNPYGYGFHWQLFPAAMQGQQAAPEMIAQIDRIQKLDRTFDCVVIVRGGGARLDLMAFDDFGLNKKVAECPLPVLVGIGHQTDDSILDQVAHLSLKTPTAAADYLIDHNLQFETMLLQTGNELQQHTQQYIYEESVQLEKAHQTVRWQSINQLGAASQKLDFQAAQLQQHSKTVLQHNRQLLDHFEQIERMLSPSATLKRGYSVAVKKGKVVVNTGQLKKGDQLQTHFSDGRVESTVMTIKKTPHE